MSVPEPSATEAQTDAAASNRTRWQTINRIFHAAVELDPAVRDAFVRTAAAGDAAVEAEVRELLAADGMADGYLEEPLLPRPPTALYVPLVEPGDTLCERFRLVRAIAEGGMGQVFEALDLELREPVALKVIRPEIAAVPEALSRFRQEVSLARKIAHPGVCRTFDINHDRRTLASGEVADVVFLTMELLAGETLAARLKREGPLPLDEALRLAGQVAEALEAAHALGIVHRDIKPSNIMLVPVVNSGAPGAAVRAVITDFGLARLDPILSGAATSALSQTARPVGTLAYMAPEQLDGAPVSTATDLYAFGLVLFEMATGKRAFPAENLLSGLTQRLTGPPPSPKLLMPDLLEPWTRAIEWCLCVNPAERPRQAGEVLAVLRGGKRAPLPAERRSWVLRIPRWAAAAVLLGGLSLSTLGYRLSVSRAKAKVAPGALVYLTPVRNQTSERALDNVTELIEAGLGQSTQINLLDRNRAGDILEQMTRSPQTVLDQPTAREIAMRANAARVVFVTVTGQNGDYRLNIDLQQPDNTPTRYRAHWTNSFAWHSAGTGASIPPELLTAVRDASDWVRHEAGESANDIARLDVPPENVTTSSWQALQEYSDAEKLQLQRQREDAELMYRRAIRDDSNFALAYARLGDLLNNLGRTGEGDRTYLLALDRSNLDRLSLREKDLIQGEYAFDTHNYQAAEDAYREFALLYQNDYAAWFRRGLPLLMLGRPAEAIEVLKRAHEIAPQSPGSVGTLVRASIAAGDLAGAEHWNQLLRATSAGEVELYGEGSIRFLRGDLQAALSSFRTLSQSKSAFYRRGGLRQMADVYAEMGDYRRARETLEMQLKKEPEDARIRAELAAVLCAEGNRAGCVAQIELVTRESVDADLLIRASGILGRAMVNATGAEAPAVRMALAPLEAKLPANDFGVISTVARSRVHGEVLLARGDVAGALREFRKADALDAPFASREYLGRALMAAAAHEPNSAAARALRTEALQAFAGAALNPGMVWSFPLDYTPGFYADQLGAWLSVARRLGGTDPAFPDAERKYRLLRPQMALAPA